jgi:hypothetical protein
MRTRRIGAGLVAALLGACGGGSKGTGAGPGGTTSIAITGGALQATLGDAASAGASGTCTASTGAARLAFVDVRATTIADTCQAEQQGRDPASATSLDIVLVRVAAGASGPALAIATGSYPFWDGFSTLPFDAQGVAWVMQGSARRSGLAVSGQGACATLGHSAIASGAVTVTEASVSGVAGTIDVTLADGERAQGTFSAPTCALALGLDAACNPTGAPPTTACM